MVEITHLDASPDTRVPKASVRAADGTAAAATLGLNFGSSEQRGDTLVVRIRPDEWYLLGDSAPAMADGLDPRASPRRSTSATAALPFASPAIVPPTRWPNSGARTSAIT